MQHGFWHGSYRDGIQCNISHAIDTQMRRMHSEILAHLHYSSDLSLFKIVFCMHYGILLDRTGDLLQDDIVPLKNFIQFLSYRITETFTISYAFIFRSGSLFYFSFLKWKYLWIVCLRDWCLVAGPGFAFQTLISSEFAWCGLTYYANGEYNRYISNGVVNICNNTWSTRY